MDTKKDLVGIVIIILVIAGGLGFYYSNKNKNLYTQPQNKNVGMMKFVPGPVVGFRKSATLGKFMTDAKGMTLYTFANDKKLESVCVDACAKNWPPFLYDKKDPTAVNNFLSKPIVVMQRADGTFQYAYDQKPLYYYVGDTKPDDMKGNGLNGGKWSIVPVTR